MKDFSLNVNSSVYDVLIISESWLCQNISNEELNLNNYNIFRADRNSNTSEKVCGGGVLIAVKKDFRASVILSGRFVESIYINFKHNNLDLIVGGVYIPPASHLNVYENYCSDLECIFEKFPNSSYIIAGDFNLPLSNWNRNDMQFNSFGNFREYCEVICLTAAFMNMQQVRGQQSRLPHIREENTRDKEKRRTSEEIRRGTTSEIKSLT